MSGPGAGAILEDEGGLHVLETVGTRDGDTEIERIAVSVEIVGASPGEPVGERDVVAQAVIGLDSVELPGQVTRRYQFAPSARSSGTRCAATAPGGPTASSPATSTCMARNGSPRASPLERIQLRRPQRVRRRHTSIFARWYLARRR